MQGKRAIQGSDLLARRGATAAVVVALATVLLAAPAGSIPHQSDPRVAPVTRVSSDGRTGTDGTRTLSLSQAAGLEPDGQTIAVAGSGYDAGKGIYVALCVIPPRNHQPSPCGGGVDVEGQAGAAQWISSNPPDYGAGLAQPYGPGGSFSTRFTVRAQIAAGIDCRQVRCAVVTRADHTRTADRSQDIIVPVSFRADPVPAGPSSDGGAPGPAGGGQTPGAPATSAPPTVAVPSTAVPATAPSRAPEATLDEHGRAVTDGRRTLEVSQARGLDPSGTEVTVSARGFDETAGVYVSLCAAADDPATAPGPCATGTGRSAWVSSTAPDHSRHLAIGWGAGGSFEATLELAAAIDADTDCRTIACAVVVRFDDERRADRTGDLAIPVRFLEASPTTSTSTSTPTQRSTAAPADATSGEGDATTASDLVAADDDASAVPLVAAAVGLPALAAAVVLGLRRRARLAREATS